jgi:hypothetical protein
MLRELDQRRSAGLVVTLEWDSDTDTVSVRCEHEHSDVQPLCYPVEPHDARRAFLHPFGFGTAGHHHASFRQDDHPAIPDSDCDSHGGDDLEPYDERIPPAAAAVTALICGWWLICFLLLLVFARS